MLFRSVMQVPKLDKIVINMGVGEAKENAKLLDAAIADMELITGQDVRTGSVMAGQIAGLLHRRQPCREIIRELVEETEALLKNPPGIQF